ncbi:MAG: ATPase AAA-2 domain protein [Candidatus Woesebacteria bacterium GW2011_GWB1_38_5b]|uniref:ATPase AAA-2 domain protein n=1 Tax=Candidatus Woesebacteria bacterium GW2011_GWB1_38_5b TaxID=1618569 RepID=A0A0G0K7A1_9BACT|nr:MAG: ATPase AAA-2 domain protein [Candidatus Woesebacteria bacterium GW2011_GWB1_38_5b]OGH48183.1 MAG: hypothetical protein A3A51_04120 [Candidatus Levybacteria bacterium RIFCSPLOWO2_01_FULL_39_10]
MRDVKIRIMLFYHSIPVFIVRVAVINVLILLSLFMYISGNSPNFFLFLLSVFIIIEVFVKFSLEVVRPSASLNDNPQDIFDAFTKEALIAVFKKDNTPAFLTAVNKLKQTKFLLDKAVISENEIVSLDVPTKELTDKAAEIAKKLKGKYITSTDLLTSYLVLTEATTKLLFNKKLKEEDIINIDHWARIIFEEEEPRQFKPRYAGVGIGELLVWGWTPETMKYTRDHTYSNIKRKTMVDGRETEYKTLIDAMQKETNNNVLLVGDIGTGKSNLVENFIYQSYEGQLPKKLNHKRFLELMIGPLVAGAGNRSELETRLQAVIEEVKHSVNVVLYIPEFQNLLGGASFNIDLSGAMLPYLKDGKMPIIATMTKGEYKKYFENNALREVFEIIVLDEPGLSDALRMLFEKTEEIENENGVILSYKAVVSAAKFAKKYKMDGVLPGIAVDLLMDSANSAYTSKGRDSTVLEDDVLSKIEVTSKIPMGAPKEKEKNLLLNLESEMHKFVIGQDEAIKSISEAMRRIRAGITREKPISFLFLGPTGVGKTETAKTLARLYFGGEANIVRLDMSEYGTEDGLTRLIESGSGKFLDQIHAHPFSLVLLDEFEKADSKILNLFLQVLDDGRMTDSAGKTFSFSNAIIIATSNAGSEFIRESLVKDNSLNTTLNNKALLEYIQEQGIFRPELLNRFDEVVMFKPLMQAEISQITGIMLKDLSAKLSEQDIYLSFDQTALDMISKNGYNEEFGARPLRRFIQDNVDDVLAKKILSGEMVRGDKIVISADQSSNLQITKQA